MSPRHSFFLALGVAAVLSARTVVAADDADTTTRQEDERLLKEARVSSDSAALLAFFRKRTLSADDRRGLESLVIQLGHRSFRQREKASRKLEDWGPPALTYLTPARLNADLEISRRAERSIEVIQLGPGPALPAAAARCLTRHKAADAIAVLLGYLPFADDDSVQEEIFACLALLGKDSPSLAPLLPAVNDPAAVKRAAAGYVLGRSSDLRMREGVRKLLLDGEALVRLRAAQGLLAARDRSAVPALIDLLAAPASELTWQAEDLLLRVAGDAPSTPVLDSTKDTGRRDYRDRWVKWWHDNATRISLDKVEQEAPQRGWSVVAQMSTSKVYEIDRSGKVRWSIDNLSGPIDAQILTGERILIAEHHGSKVTERNLQGTVLWEKRLDDRPVQTQRLPGGNIFICTYSALLEVTRDGKEVYRHKPEGTSGQIYGGHKLRNGRIVCITLDGRILELDSTSGKVVKTLPSGMNGCYSIQALPRGHYLVSSYNEGKVHELDPAGKVVWRFDLASAYHAERLPNGNTLVSSHGGSRVVEVDRAGKLLNEHGTNHQNVWRVHRR